MESVSYNFLIFTIWNQDKKKDLVEEDDSELFGEDFAVGYVKSLLRI